MKLINPELYYKIGNASTIISTMGTPIASGVPIEKVMATQTKCMVSGTVGSVASNALMDRYDLNPYVAMGIGMGISGLTYRGIDSIEVDTTMGIIASGGKGVKSTTSNKNDIQSYTYNMVENPGPLAEIDVNQRKTFLVVNIILKYLTKIEYIIELERKVVH